MDFDSPYVTKQIIAYIGNKRKLLALIYNAMQSTGLDLKPGLRFFDVFAGSGIVSRLAKSLGFEVFCNDWEFYASVINRGFIQTNKKDIEKCFGSYRSFLSLLGTVNRLPDPAEEQQYIARYYAPHDFDIDRADFKKERLFYTRENALAIDKIRNYIEETFPPGEPEGSAASVSRNLLISLLLYEAATHNNTSGVFKACHKGFGGHNKDALKRILAPIQLHEPVLIDSGYPVHVFQTDANELVKSGAVQNIDIAYLDPPYNQHQYGSNYHMLTTIAKWDKIPMPLVYNSNGELKEKAAIRHDWIETRSPYCYQHTAVAAFADLIQNIEAKHILVSYSTDGIIPFEHMQDICRTKGRISIVTNEYTTYKGGRQSNSRLNTNIEFIICIDTSCASDRQSVQAADNIIARKKLLLLFKQKFCAHKLKECVNVAGDTLYVTVGGKEMAIQTHCLFELYPPENCTALSIKELEELHEILFPCICRTKEEELHELLAKIAAADSSAAMFAKKIPDTLKKLAHKKNRTLFFACLDMVKKNMREYPGLYALIEKKIAAVELLAEKRFAN